MARSIWRETLGAFLCFAVLACCRDDASLADGPPGSGPYITIYDNGQNVACRVVSSSRMPDGSQTYKLQVVATGEYRTYTYDKSYFNPPQTGSIAQWRPSQPGPVPPAPVIVGNPKETIIWWEEGKGSPSTPQGVLPAGTTFPTAPIVAQPPVIVPTGSSFPVTPVVQQPSVAMPTGPTYPVNPGTPSVLPGARTFAPLPEPVQINGGYAQRMIVAGPTSQPAVQTRPVYPVVTPKCDCNSSLPQRPATVLYVPERQTSAGTGSVAPVPGTQVAKYVNSGVEVYAAQPDAKAATPMKAKSGFSCDCGNSIGPIVPAFSKAPQTIAQAPYTAPASPNSPPVAQIQFTTPASPGYVPVAQPQYTTPGSPSSPSIAKSQYTTPAAPVYPPVAQPQYTTPASPSSPPIAKTQYLEPAPGYLPNAVPPAATPTSPTNPTIAQAQNSVPGPTANPYVPANSGTVSPPPPTPPNNPTFFQRLFKGTPPPEKTDQPLAKSLPPPAPYAMQSTQGTPGLAPRTIYPSEPIVQPNQVGQSTPPVASKSTGQETVSPSVAPKNSPPAGSSGVAQAPPPPKNPPSNSDGFMSKIFNRPATTTAQNTPAPNAPAANVPAGNMPAKTSAGQGAPIALPVAQAQPDKSTQTVSPLIKSPSVSAMTTPTAPVAPAIGTIPAKPNTTAAQPKTSDQPQGGLLSKWFSKNDAQTTPAAPGQTPSAPPQTAQNSKTPSAQTPTTPTPGQTKPVQPATNNPQIAKTTTGSDKTAIAQAGNAPKSDPPESPGFFSKLFHKDDPAKDTKTAQAGTTQQQPVKKTTSSDVLPAIQPKPAIQTAQATTGPQTKGIDQTGGALKIQPAAGTTKTAQGPAADPFASSAKATPAVQNTPKPAPATVAQKPATDPFASTVKATPAPQTPNTPKPAPTTVAQKPATDPFATNAKATPAAQTPITPKPAPVTIAQKPATDPFASSTTPPATTAQKPAPAVQLAPVVAQKPPQDPDKKTGLFNQFFDKPAPAPPIAQAPATPPRSALPAASPIQQTSAQQTPGQPSGVQLAVAQQPAGQPFPIQQAVAKDQDLPKGIQQTQATVDSPRPTDPFSTATQAKPVQTQGPDADPFKKNATNLAPFPIATGDVPRFAPRSSLPSVSMAPTAPAAIPSTPGQAPFPIATGPSTPGLAPFTVATGPITSAPSAPAGPAPFPIASANSGFPSGPVQTPFPLATPDSARMAPISSLPPIDVAPSTKTNIAGAKGSFSQTTIAQGPVPFTTAIPANQTPKLPAIASAAPTPVPADIKQVSGVAQAPLSPAPTAPVPQGPVAQGPPSSTGDWRSSWDKTPTPAGPGALPTSSQKEGAFDPLEHPENFNPSPKLLPTPPVVTPSVPKLAKSSDAKPGDAKVQQTAFTPPAESTSTAGLALPTGMASVAAARNAGTPISYVQVPVPVVTIPDLTRPPSPPPAQIPQPPNPNNYVNAFTPPQQAQGTASMPTMDLSGYARPPMVNPMALAQVYARNPFLVNPALLQHGIQNFAQLPPQQQYQVQEAMYVQHQTVMQQSQAAVYQQSMMAKGAPAYGYPANYQGPNPFVGGYPNGSGIIQTQYQQNAQYAPTGYPYPQTPLNPNVQQWLSVLVESPYPPQREWAATSLSSCGVHPQIVQALLDAARHDPAPSVRAGCVYSLSRMNVDNATFMDTLKMLQNDTDPRVRQEVQQAYAHFVSH